MARPSGFLLPRIGDLIVLAGIATIALLCWLPHQRARHMAEAEIDAAHTLRILLKACAVTADTRLGDQRAAPEIARTVRERGGEDLEPTPPPPSLAGVAWMLTGAQYVFLVTAAPDEVIPAANTEPKALRPRTRPPLEAYAFPRSALSYGRSAFFVAEDLPSAFSRNLLASYSGAASSSLPSRGGGRPREEPDPEGDPERDYRGNDNERWIFSWTESPETPTRANEPLRRTRTGSR